MISSLDLLTNYESDEDSTNEDISPTNETTIAVPRLPLPNALKITPVDNVEDDPKLHDGRIRSYPHQRGNWNSLIFIPYKRNGPFDLLCEQIIEFCVPRIEMKLVEEPHISLTKTFILYFHWIDNFVVSLNKSLNLFSKFDLQFEGLKVYCNEEKTRTFLALSVGFGKMEIMKTVELLNICLSEYKLQPFYEEASFHMSILWCLGDKKREVEELLFEMNKILEANRNDALNLTIHVTKYICKIGNKIFNLDLL